MSIVELPLGLTTLMRGARLTLMSALVVREEWRFLACKVVISRRRGGGKGWRGEQMERKCWPLLGEVDDIRTSGSISLPKKKQVL